MSSFRKWLLSSVVCSSFLTAAPGYGAESRPEILYPKSSWAVSKITARQLGGGEYCALARRFDQSIILTIARNGNDESSVAVDFQQKTLGKSKAYDVTLDPGFGQGRTYSIQPVSDKALVVRLGQDYAFLDALTRSGKLAVRIGDKAYQFGVPDMDAGQGQLNGCLVSLTEPAAGDSVPALPVPDKGNPEPLLPEAPPVVSALVDDQIRTLREENARLRSALQQERRIFEDRFLKEGKDSSLITELNERVGLLETENNELRQQVSESVMASGACPVSDTSAQERLEKEVSRLSEENSQLKAQIHSLQYKVSSLGEAAGQARAEADERLKEQLSAAEERARQAEARLAEARTQIEAVEKTARLAEDERADLARQITETGQRGVLAEKRLAEARQEIQDLKQRIETAEAARTDVNEQVVAAEQRAQAAEARLVEARRQIEEIEQRVKSAENAREETGQRIAETEARAVQAEKQLAEARQEVEDLRRQAGITEAARADVDSQVAAAEQRARAAEARLAEARGRIDELEQRASSSEDRQADVGKKIADAEARAKQAEEELVEAGQRIAILEQKLETAQQRIEALRTESAQVQERAEKAFLELAEANRKLESNLAMAAQNEAGSAEADVSGREEVQNLLEHIAVLEAENRDLKISLQAADADRKAVSAVTPMPDEGAVLATRLRTLESEFESVKSERDRLMREIADLRTAREDKLVQVSASNWDLEQATRRYNEAEREIRRLGLAIEKERDRCDKEKKEIEYMLFDPAIATQEQIARLHELERELISREAELAAQKSQFETKVASLESELAAARGHPGLPSATVASSAGRGYSNPMTQEAREMAAIAPAAGTAVTDTALAARLPAPVQAYELDNAAVRGGKPTAGGASDSKTALITSEALNSLFGAAGLTVKNLAKVDSVSGSDLVAFSWETADVFGSAEQRRLSGPDAFTGMTRDYIARTQSRCAGEFAVVPVLSEQEGGRQLATYEIACVGNQDSHDASASLLFIGENGLFTAVAHEASVSSMDTAMDVRDRLAEAFRNVKLAASR